jgi:hypothetical protein
MPRNPSLRPATIVAALVAVVVVLAGCGPAVKSVTGEQTGGVGSSVRLAQALCDTESPQCERPWGSGTGHVVFAAYLLPDGFSPAVARVAGSTTAPMTTDAEFADLLEARKPAPEGSRWIGFRSAKLPAPTDVDQALRFELDVDLPADRDEPLGEMAYDTYLGYAFNPPTADVAFPCPDQLTNCQVRGAETAGVVDLRDVRLRAPALTAIEPGFPAVVEIPVGSSGEATADELVQTVTSSVPGTSSAAPVTFTEAGTKAIAVKLDVPADAKPGDYGVEATVRLADGLTRRVSAPVRVLPAPKPAADNPELAFTATEVGRAARLDLRLSLPAGRRAILRAPQVVGEHAEDFAVVVDECSGEPLRPVTNCRVGIDFLPKANGTRTATVRVPTNGGDVEVPLRGLGLPAIAELEGALRAAATSGHVDHGLRVEQVLPVGGSAAFRLRLLPEGPSSASAAPTGLLVAPVLKRSVEGPGRVVTFIKLTRQGRRAVRTRKGVRLLLTTAYTDVRGRRTVVRAPVTLGR